MLRALIHKELRESLPLVALAAAFVAYSLTQLWDVSLIKLFSINYGAQNKVPFVEDNLWGALVMIGWLLAVTLGMKQTHWEEVKGTYLYLLDRPMERRRIFATKFAVGVALVSGLMGLMILAHGLWAATPGHHPSPFYWSMTVPAWHAWFVLPVLYAAAFLSGIRPGRWFGTKLLPLAGGVLIATIFTLQPWPWIALVGSALFASFYVSTSINVGQTRDY